MTPPRDDAPDPRFSLANERTLLAWNRTALALAAAGLAVAELLEGGEAYAARRVVGSALIISGGLVAGRAFGDGKSSKDRLVEASRCRTPPFLLCSLLLLSLRALRPSS